MPEDPEIIIWTELHSWKDPYGSLNPAPVKEAQMGGIKLPTSDSAARCLNHWATQQLIKMYFILELLSWKGPYGSLSLAPVKEAQWGIELPTSGSAASDLNCWANLNPMHCKGVSLWCDCTALHACVIHRIRTHRQKAILCFTAIQNCSIYFSFAARCSAIVCDKKWLFKIIRWYRNKKIL